MGYDRLSDIPAPLASLGDIYTRPFHSFSFYRIDSIEASVVDAKQAAVVVHDLNVYPVLIKG